MQPSCQDTQGSSVGSGTGSGGCSQGGSGSRSRAAGGQQAPPWGPGPWAGGGNPEAGAGQGRDVLAVPSGP